MRLVIKMLVIALALIAAPLRAADDYPTRPVR